MKETWQNCACVAQMSWFRIMCFDMLKRPLRWIIWIYLWHASHERWLFLELVQIWNQRSICRCLSNPLGCWSGRCFPSKPKGGFDGTIFRQVEEFGLYSQLSFCTVFVGFCWGYFIWVPGTQLPGRMLGSLRIGRGVSTCWMKHRSDRVAPSSVFGGKP